MKLKSIIIASVVPVLVIVLMTFMSVVSFAEETTPSWVTKKSLTTPRNFLGSAVINQRIYTFGGTNSNSVGKVEEYDPKTDIWTAKSFMKNPRCAFASVVFDNKIFVIGGYTGADPYHPGNNYTNVVEVYDPVTDTWTSKTSMPTSREFCSAAVLNGKIYVVGGYNGSYINTVEIYDPVTGNWTKGTNYPTSIAGSALVTLNNKMFSIGGYTNGFLSTVRQYDSSSDTWILKQPMKYGVKDFGTALINGNIVVMGGNSNGTAINSVQVYDVINDTWDSMVSMEKARIGLTSSEIDGSIYTISGDDVGSVESLSLSTVSSNPTLTTTASAAKVKIGEQFTTDIAIHNVTNICAEDIKITYDTNLFEYVGATAQTGLKIYKEDTSTPGTVRFIVACQGKDNVATGDKNLIQLKFKAKAMGTGKVDIVKGRIADNSTLEMDVADENCGEATIEVIGGKDVNRSGAFTLLDLGIDAYYYGLNAADTDTTKYDADQDVNGKIDDTDLTSITQSILANKDYPLN